MQTHVGHPPRRMQGAGYNGPITLSQFQRFQHVRDALGSQGFSIGMPSGN